MKKHPATPPKWAERFLSWYCRRSLLEDLQGDLREYFERNVIAKGPVRARLIYILDVLKFFKPYTVRKPEFINLLIHWLMIGSYLKTSARSIVRNKLFSVINIVGLAISMSVGLLIITLVSDLLSYDNFHAKKDRIYRVNTHDEGSNRSVMNLASTSVVAGKLVRETVTGVEDVTLIRRGFGGDAKVGEAIIPIGGLFADESFLKVFSFSLLKGDPATALKEPYSLVLTEQSAKKLFGDEDALGKPVVFDTTTYLVTGVLKDIPKLSHLRFESLVSFSTVEIQKPDTDGGFLNWESIYMNHVYITIPEGGKPQMVQANLDKLSASQNAGIENRKIMLTLQPLEGISTGKKVTNNIGPTMPSIALWILGGLAAIVILSACFNYTNLSIARSLRRSREVGIRKVIGARKIHVMSQFMAESVIIALLALVLSFLLFLVLRAQLLSLDPHIESLASLELSPRLIVYFVAMAVVVGMVSGLLPAAFFARINAIQVLKDVSSLQVFRHISLRKALVVIQYVFSLIFITITILGYNQYKSFLTYDLGFSTENIVNIRMNGSSNDVFVKELSEIPEVNGISRSVLVTSLGSIYGSQLKYNNIDSGSVWMNLIDEHYLPLHEYKLLAGRNFHPLPEGADESEVIVNEQVLKRFDMGGKNPAKALDEMVIVDNKKLTIVGVVKDFHYETLEDEIRPVVFRYSANKSGGYINAKISTQDWPATFARVEKAWKKVDKIHPLDARFYDEQIEEAYSQFSVMVKVIGFLGFLAVCIASMGLFGMVVFTTETRLKEISIRKVLGASEGTLVYLLGKGFLLLLTIAALVALPLTYLFFDKVVLTNFAYHQPIGIGELLIGATMIMIIAIAMIGVQTIKVARANPAEVLKNE